MCVWERVRVCGGGERECVWGRGLDLESESVCGGGGEWV